jgi:hypothetical protein
VRQVRARIIVVAVLSLQIAIPAWALATRDDRPARFGWHMFASFEALPRVVLVEGGERLRLTRSGFDRIVPLPRTEIDYFEVLPAAVCRRYPKAQSVELRLDDRVEVTQCG